MVYEQAHSCFREIAATMKGWAVRLLYYVLQAVVRVVFDDIELHGFDRLRATAAKYPTVVLPSHRSHFDYVLVGWTFYHSNMSLPYVAAGDNLNFWPVGGVLLRHGR